MFRVTQYLQALREPTPVGPRRVPRGPVVIWNLTRRCNLTCRHCYAVAANREYPGELSLAEIAAVMDDLAGFGVPALILSGGEPMLRPDLRAIAAEGKARGFYLSLSTNGTMIDESTIEELAMVGYDYVGISLDGLRETHDAFRRLSGAFDASLRGLRLCRDRGLKVGVRFTLTRDNADELPALLELVEAEGIDKFYLSHLNYAGRGNLHRERDAMVATTRAAMDVLFDTVWRQLEAGRPKEVVTGNNDADGVYLLHWAARRHPERVENLRAKLSQWGGNSTGVNVANIDNLGNVHPDTMWWDHTLGNVRERPFSQIWADRRDPLMDGLKSVPRPVKGRCGACAYLDVCGGNTRMRALQLTGDPWAEDPGCYLTDAEIGLAPAEVTR